MLYGLVRGMLPPSSREPSHVTVWKCGTKLRHCNYAVDHLVRAPGRQCALLPICWRITERPILIGQLRFASLASGSRSGMLPRCTDRRPLIRTCRGELDILDLATEPPYRAGPDLPKPLDRSGRSPGTRSGSRSGADSRSAISRPVLLVDAVGVARGDRCHPTSGCRQLIERRNSLAWPASCESPGTQTRSRTRSSPNASRESVLDELFLSPSAETAVFRDAHW